MQIKTYTEIPDTKYMSYDLDALTIEQLVALRLIYWNAEVPAIEARKALYEIDKEIHERYKNYSHANSFEVN